MKSRSGQLIQQTFGGDVDAIIRNFKPSFLYHNEDAVGVGLHFDALFPDITALPHLMAELERQGKNVTGVRIAYPMNYANPLVLLGKSSGFDVPVGAKEHDEMITLRRFDKDYRPNPYLEGWLQKNKQEFNELRKYNSLYWTDEGYTPLPLPTELNELIDDSGEPIETQKHPMQLRINIDPYGIETRDKVKFLSQDMERQLFEKAEAFIDKHNGNMKFLSNPQVGRPQLWHIRDISQKTVITKSAQLWYKEYKPYFDTWYATRKPSKPIITQPVQPVPDTDTDTDMPPPPPGPPGPSPPPPPPEPDTRPPDINPKYPPPTPNPDEDDYNDDDDDHPPPRDGGGGAILLADEIAAAENSYKDLVAALNRRIATETAVQRVRTEMGGINDAEEHRRRLKSIYDRHTPTAPTGPRPRPKINRPKTTDTATDKTDKTDKTDTVLKPRNTGKERLFEDTEDFENTQQQRKVKRSKDNDKSQRQSNRPIIAPLKPAVVEPEPAVVNPIEAAAEEAVRQRGTVLTETFEHARQRQQQEQQPQPQQEQQPQQNRNVPLSGALEDETVRHAMLFQMEQNRKTRELYTKNQWHIQKEQERLRMLMGQQETELRDATRQLQEARIELQRARAGHPPPRPPPGGGPPPPPPGGGPEGDGSVSFKKEEEKETNIKREHRDTTMGVPLPPSGPPGPSTPPVAEGEEKKPDKSAEMRAEGVNTNKFVNTTIRAPIDEEDEEEEDDYEEAPHTGGFNPATDVLHIPMMRRRIWTQLREAFTGHPRCANPNAFFAPEKHPYPETE